MLTVGKLNVNHEQLVDKEKLVSPATYKAWFDEAICESYR